MKKLLAFLFLLTATASAQYCGESTRAMRAYEPTRILGVSPNPAREYVVVALKIGEPGTINFQWFNSSGLPVRPSSREVTRGQWLVMMDVYMLPRGQYWIRAEHDASGFVGVVRVWLR